MKVQCSVHDNSNDMGTKNELESKVTENLHLFYSGDNIYIIHT